MDFLATGQESIVVKGLPPDLNVLLIQQNSADPQQPRYLEYGQPGYSDVIVDMRPNSRPLDATHRDQLDDLNPMNTRRIMKAVAKAKVDSRLLKWVSERNTAAAMQSPPLLTSHFIGLSQKDCSTEKAREASGDDCLSAIEIPGGSLWSVATREVCGDLCTTLRELYNPRSKQFIDVGDPAAASNLPHEYPTDLTGARISKDGTAIVAGGRAIRLSDGVVFGEDGNGGGFIGFDQAVPLP